MSRPFTITRSTSIAARPEEIHALVDDFHEWSKWSPWEDLDPDLRRTYAGAESGTGAVYSWSGNRRAGQGRMEILDATAPSLVQIDLAFEKPWKARNDTVFSIEPQGSGSRVTWSMTGKKTLMTRLMGLVKSMDKMLGPDFEKGLTRLKAAAEGSAAG